MELWIRNMVCGRCITTVRAILKEHGLTPTAIDLGVVRLQEETISPKTIGEIALVLQEHGFELLDNAKSKLLEKIKTLIINKVHRQERLDLKVNWSDLIANELHHDYSSLSSLFSSVEGYTIEQFIIRQKIEKAKELIFYDEKNFSEIAYLLGYSSVQHLSTQFKKTSGLTPSEFKKLKNAGAVRKPLDGV